MKKFLTAACALALCLSLSACGCEHQWQEAGCETPKTCSLCGETEGEALGHDWKEADCEHPETCTRCGETRGEALGHEPGDWVQKGTNMVKAEAYLAKSCTRCGESLEIMTESLDTLIENFEIPMSLNQFQERMDLILDRILREKVHKNASSDLYEVDGDYYYLVEHEGLKVCGFALMSGDNHMTPDQGDSFDLCLNAIYDPTSKVAAAGSISMLETLDPSFSDGTASDFLVELADHHFNNGVPKCRNGIAYTMVQENDSSALMLLAVLIKPEGELYNDENMGLAK